MFHNLARLILAAFVSLVPAAFAGDFQLLVFPKQAEAKQMEIVSLPAAELASHLSELQPAIEARNISVSGEETETRLQWQADNIDFALTLRTKLTTNLQFGVSLRTTVESGFFGASMPSKTRSAAGDVPLPVEKGYLLDAGNVIIVLAPAQSVPATVGSNKLTSAP